MLAVLKRAALIVSKSDRANFSRLAKLIGAPRCALYAWKQIPAKYVLRIKKVTNGKIKPWDMRDDLYPRPGSPREKEYGRVALGG